MASTLPLRRKNPKVPILGDHGPAETHRSSEEFLVRGVRTAILSRGENIDAPQAQRADDGGRYVMIEVQRKRHASAAIRASSSARNLA